MFSKTQLEKMAEVVRRRRAALWDAGHPDSSPLCRSALWAFAHMRLPGEIEMREIVVKALRRERRRFTQAKINPMVAP